MKIGILTYQNTRNCGAILQAYALQQKMFDLGIDNEIIDYRCKKIEESYKIKRLCDIKSVKELVKWILTIRSHRDAQKKFDAFKKNMLKLSDMYDKDTISDSNKEFDGFITGSDQVWNFSLNGEDYTYLLDFAESGKKKISYAASMGSKIATKESEYYLKKEMDSFDAVSVREKTLEMYVREITEVTPRLVLDPTLLLRDNDYNFLYDWNEPKYKYIFVYTVAPTANIEKSARELSKKTGYPIIWGHMSYKKKRGVKNITTLSPEEFVNYIKNAEYVLTSSFHGMAFAIIMKRQFFYDLNVNKQNNNSRLETLAELLGLKERELKEGKEIRLDSLIDYKQIEERLGKIRQTSIEFLKDSFAQKQ